MKNTANLIQSILKNRKEFIELFIVAIVIGFGISLAASSILEYCSCENKGRTFLIVGVVLSLLGLFYYIIKLYGARSFSSKIDGFFIIDSGKKEVVDIDSYDYSNKLYEIWKYALVEDKALDSKWNNINFDTHDKTYADFLNIMQEASEYYLLDKLSDHLSAYFDKIEYNKAEFDIYQRNEMPGIFLENRFLELFSKPMNQRAAFLSNNLDGLCNDDEDVYTVYLNGAKYQRFEMKLPKGGKIERDKDKSIVITTNRFTIRLKAIVSGTNTYIPWQFCNIYLGLKFNDIMSYIFETRYEIDVNFKFGSLFRTEGWSYYYWIDSFIVELEKKIDRKYYFENTIEWERSYNILKPLIKMQMNSGILF